MESYQTRDFWAGYSETWRYKANQKSWRTARTNNWVLILCQRGRGVIQSSDGTIAVKDHDVLLLSPGHNHTFTAGENWEILWIHFMLPGTMRARIQWKESLPGFRIAHLDNVVFAKVKMSMHEAYSLSQTQPVNWYDYAMTLLNEVLFRIDNFIPSTGKTGAKWLLFAVEELMSLPEKNIDDIARECGMSRTKFYNAFQKQTGYSPSQYRDNIRMRKAEQMLLSTRQTVSQISDSLGFNSPFYFSRRFKIFYGCSPREYRASSGQFSPSRLPIGDHDRQ